MNLLELLFVFNSVLFINAFNFYLDSSSVIESDFSYFGYSTAIQKNRLYVGAPKAHNYGFRNYSGLVFKCEKFKDCEPLKLSTVSDDGYLLGASMDSGIESYSSFIFCSPKYHTDGHTKGRCVRLKKGTDVEIIDPMRNVRISVYNKLTSELIYYSGFAQSGFSVKFQNENNLILGAPGFKDGKGTIINHHDGNSEYSEKMSNQAYSYAGYDVTYGKFAENGPDLEVLGAPRSDDLFGKVYIMDPHTQEIVLTLRGKQFGGYFGSAICTIDINGDGLDDLIIGAPTFKLNQYEEGRVYVYINSGKNMFSENPQYVLDGATVGGRFGTTIRNLGKVFDEFDGAAISAPYENNGVGTVYIYRGSKDGLKLAQKITSQTFDLFRKASGFGFSLSKSVDIDNNNFNDFAIGAYGSSQVFMIKSKPIIELWIKNVRSSIDSIIVGETKEFEIFYCIGFNTKSKTLSQQGLQDLVNVEVNADVRRVYLKSNFKTSATSTGTCLNQTIKLKTLPNLDYKPIQINIQASLDTNNGNCSTCPMEDPTRHATALFSIPVSRNCASNNQCLPVFHVRNLNEGQFFTVGSSTKLPLQLSVENTGEPAYLCEMNLQLEWNARIDYLPGFCKDEDHSMVKCDMGNPLDTNSNITLEMSIDVSNVDFSSDKYCFSVELSSSDKIGDLKADICIPLIYDRSLTITGISNPGILYYEDRKNDTFDEFSQDFTIINKGPSPYKGFTIELNIPYKVDDAKFKLLDIYDPMVFLDNVQKNEICNFATNYKPLTYINTTSNESVPRVVRSIIIEENSTNDENANNAWKSIPISNIVELNNINYITIVCSVTRLKNSMIIKIPIRINLTETNNYYSKNLKENKVILLQSEAKLTASPKTYYGTAVTILEFTTEGVKLTNWQYGLIIFFAILISLAILIGIIYGLYKFNFFSRPLKEKMEDTKNLQLVDANPEGIELNADCGESSPVKEDAC